MTHRDYENSKLPMSGTDFAMKKKDAWIVWTTEEGLINDFVVYFRPIGEEFQYRREKISNLVHARCNTIGYCDIGNTCSDWENITLTELLLKFFHQYGFVDDNVALCAMEQLMFIDEFRKELEPVMTRILHGKGLDFYYTYEDADE